MEIIACGDFHLPDRQLCTPMYSLVSQKMKKIKMVALDLDGTTLNSAHNLTDGVIETLRDISQSGVTVCIATGRSLDTVACFFTLAA